MFGIGYLRGSGLAGNLVIAVLQVLGGTVFNNSLEQRLRLADCGAGAYCIGYHLGVK